MVPFMILAIAVAVVPVLYFSIRHEHERHRVPVRAEVRPVARYHGVPVARR